MSTAFDLTDMDLADELDADDTSLDSVDEPLATRFRQVRVARKQRYLQPRAKQNAKQRKFREKKYARARAARRAMKGLPSRGPEVLGVQLSASHPEGEPAWTERMISVAERVGRVRDIDLDREVFLAILNGRNADEPELVATFPLSLVEPADRDRFKLGAEFTLSTGRRVVIYAGQVFPKPGLQTSIVLHRHVGLPQTVAEQARAAGRAARAALKAI